MYKFKESMGESQHLVLIISFFFKRINRCLMVFLLESGCKDCVKLHISSIG